MTLFFLLVLRVFATKGVNSFNIQSRTAPHKLTYLWMVWANYSFMFKSMWPAMAAKRDMHGIERLAIASLQRAARYKLSVYN